MSKQIMKNFFQRFSWEVNHFCASVRSGTEIFWDLLDNDYIFLLSCRIRTASLKDLVPGTKGGCQKIAYFSWCLFITGEYRLLLLLMILHS